MPENVHSDEMNELHSKTFIVDEIYDDERVETYFSALELFTEKDCGSLSFVLSEHFNRCEIVQIVTEIGPLVQLIHSGLKVGGRVYDIEGGHEVDDWIEKWGRGLYFRVRLFDCGEDAGNCYGVYPDGLTRARLIINDLIETAEFSEIASLRLERSFAYGS